MNKSQARELIQRVVVLVPRPRLGAVVLSQARNRWIVLSEGESGNGLNLLNTITEHSFMLEYPLMRNFQETESLILRGQVVLDERGPGVIVEPFADIPDQGNLEDERRQRVKDLLGVAQKAGQQMSRANSFKVVGQEWGKATHQLILEAFGEGEAALFESDAGEVFSSAMSISREMAVHLRRLAELITRCDSLQVRTAFDLTEEKEKTWREKYVAFEHC